MKGMFGSSKKTYFITIRQLKFAFKNKQYWKAELDNHESPLI